MASNAKETSAMNIYQPYTYLIGWTAHNKWYYGARYAKKCHPTDLWVKYFTSSKFVKYFTLKHGPPDIIQIRKIFTNGKDCLIWEQKVLARIDAAKNKNFLNAKNCTTKTIIDKPNSGSFKPGSTSWAKGKNFHDLYTDDERKRMFGRIFTQDEKQKLSDKLKITHNKPEIKNKQKQNTILQFQNEEKKKRHLAGCLQSNGNHANKIWINNGVVNKRILPQDLMYFDFLWVRGRNIPKEVISKMINNRNQVKDPITGKFIKENNI
jgi:hypothetical protein